jgi:peptidoglycan-N-acetylglucosamine deacetylase
MKTISILLIFLMAGAIVYAQEKFVAITMDDLFFAFDNISIENMEEANDALLNSITKLNIPVTVFVNEKSFIKIGETDKRLLLFKKWTDNPLITIGNHTYSHIKYTDTTVPLFEEDIIKGEAITTELLKKADKKLSYFRFPFNCTGKDSISRAEIYNYLNGKGYVIAPFTIESMDYLYNFLYCYYIKKGNEREAKEIIKKYINFTENLFHYFETVTHELYGRDIRHIFLCHTNQLNAVCFEKLIMRLKKNGYSFISLDDALEDEIYQNKDYYTGQFGISWICRWIENSEERKEHMKKEPYSEEIDQLYNDLNK